MIFGYLLVGLGLLFGFGGYETRQIERQAAANIRAQLQGPDVKVEVHTRAVGLNIVAGHFRRVTVSISKFSTPGLPFFTETGLRTNGQIDEIQIHLRDFNFRSMHVAAFDSAIPDCRFDLDEALKHRKFLLSRSGVGTGSVLILDEDLERFIRAKYPQITEVHVSTPAGQVHVSGTGEFFGVHAVFDVTAKLDAADGNRLMLADAAIVLNGKPADEAAGKVLLGILNPVLDLDRDLGLNGAFRVTKLELTEGQIQASGTTCIPQVAGPRP